MRRRRRPCSRPAAWPRPRRPAAAWARRPASSAPGGACSSSVRACQYSLRIAWWRGYDPPHPSDPR
ncbi:hypothetical protein L489_2692 [Bordetella bronchiseptica 00-P-2730]|nr:hypothetical protein L489_2692 [Bordetella bronchiseptica 00-P-2730]